MVTSLLLVALLAPPAPAATAGTGPASLACKGVAKKDAGLSLRGLIPATDEQLDLTLTDGKAALQMSREGKDRVEVVAAFEDRVFTLAVARADGRSLRLYALPRTLSFKKGEFDLHARFEAVLQQAPRPGAAGAGADATLRDVKLACQYDYEI